MTGLKIKNMAEFAEISGLSRPTISKYFIDPSSVRESTRLKIEQALRKYEYRPNLLAVNLNKKNSNIVGIIVPDTTNQFYASLVQHIEVNFVASGYLVVVLCSYGDPRMESRSIDTLLSLKVSGAIVAPLGIHSNTSMIEALGARIPIVFLDSRVDEATPFVGTDNFQSVGLITDYLCRTGDRPTFVEMPPVNHNCNERRLAYLQTMEKLNLQPEVITLGNVQSWRIEDIGYTRTMRLLAGSGFPTRTVLCANDRLAMGVMAAAFQSRLRIGREPECDLRIAGHDDQPPSRYTCPPLTTVAQDVERIAGHCVDLLLGRIGGETEIGLDGQIRIEAKLMMRASA